MATGSSFRLVLVGVGGSSKGQTGPAGERWEGKAGGSAPTGPPPAKQERSRSRAAVAVGVDPGLVALWVPGRVWGAGGLSVLPPGL